MSPSFRRLGLTLHVISSLGWLGAVMAFDAIALRGWLGESGRSAMEADAALTIVAYDVIVPLCVATFLTGIVQSLGTPWGLFRHYWILIKLIMTSVSTLVLILHLRPVDTLAHLSLRGAPEALLIQFRQQLSIEATVALAVLVFMTVLSIYKPPGLLRAAQAARKL